MNSNKKVLILCNDFPPVNSIGADRPYSWFKYFNEFGIYPVIITKNWTSDENSINQEVHKYLIKEKKDSGEIIRVAKRLTPSIWFKDNFKMKFPFFRKGLTFIEKFFCFNISFFDQHYAIYKEAENYIRDNEVHLVIASGEPFILFNYGYRLKKKFGIKWMADYRDGWYLNHVTSISKKILVRFFRIKEFYNERKCLANVNIISTVDPQLAQRLQSLHNKKVHFSYNGFWDFRNEMNLHRDRKDNEKIILSHTGTLTNGQRVELLLDSLLDLKSKGLISPKKICVNFIGLEYYPQQMKRLQKYIDQLSGIIKTTKRISKEQAIIENLKSDYLINFTDPNLSAIYAKTYTYISCAKPILVIPSDNGQLANLITNHQLGIVLNSKNEISDFILNPNLDYKPNREELNYFSRKNQAKLMINFLNKEI